jgi:hypothetical protein
VEESRLAVVDVAWLDDACADWLPSAGVTAGYTEVADEEEFMMAAPLATRLARTL